MWPSSYSFSINTLAGPQAPTGQPDKAGSVEAPTHGQDMETFHGAPVSKNFVIV